MPETEHRCDEHGFYSYIHRCPYCVERKLVADCERYRTALEAIVKHQETVGGSLMVQRIAETALNPIRPSGPAE